MSKRSRTFQPSDPHAPPPEHDEPNTSEASAPAPSTRPATTPPSGGSTPGASSRAEARRRGAATKPTAGRSFLARYGVFLAGGVGVVAVLLVLLFFNRSSTQAYECLAYLTPPPAASPASSAAGSSGPAPSPLLGFQTGDMGREHQGQGATITYAYCPPAGGGHYNLGGGRGPLARQFFGPGDKVIPPEWVHNLEHGNVVLIYRGDPGPEVLDQLRSIMDEAKVSDWSLANCGPVNKVIVVRSDDLDPGVNFAAVAWDRVLLLKEFDRDQLLGFANQWQDGPQTPERVCS